MNKISVYFLTILFSVVHAECSEMNLNECDNNQDCEWIEDIESGNCSDWSYYNTYNYNQCNAIDECEWSSYQIDCGTATGYSDCDVSAGCSYSWLTFTCSGWTTISDCSGGNYEIDNGSCQEIQMPECSEMLEGQCDDNEDCEWVEDIESGSCENLSQNQCNSTSQCSWEYECFEYGWWYDWCYEGGYVCNGGTYQIDNSYCEEIQMPDCSEMNESQCSSDDSCEWIEDIEIGDCSDITNSSECYQTNQCSWYNAGNYGYWYDNCYGGTYEIDNSYCEEVSVEYLMGDINNDFIINILDVIVIINLILDGEELAIADMNYDHSINILDIIILVDIILN